jgi:hypothetical protein
MVEMAIMAPVLVVLLYWAIAMTDIMVLRVKTAEAARFALWETTVFRTQNEIDGDVSGRFRDLRSPASINQAWTGLLLYPRAQDIVLRTRVRTNSPVSIGGKVTIKGDTGPIDWVLNKLLGLVTGTVDGATRFFKFNTNGIADVRVTLVRASHMGSWIMEDGEVLKGLSFDHSPQMTNLTFTAPAAGHNEMHLVFDTWKAWPKPAAFQPIASAPKNVNGSPMQTYQTVEEQVSAQVSQVAFYGLKQVGVITKITDWLQKVATSGVGTTLFGGKIPNILATSRMDSSTSGPITIRPVDQPDVNWTPRYLGSNGQQEGSHRLGELASYGAAVYAPYPKTAMLDKEDPSRWTVPYKINSTYFTDDGGNDKNIGKVKRKPVKPNITTNNEYVKTYRCRGHYFAGGVNAQETDFKKRYRPNCYTQ